MIIDCIGCLHGYQPKLEGGDLLIIAGDLTARDEIEQYLEFNEWLSRQDYRRKIVIAGNHDNYCEIGIPVETLPGQTPLCVPVLADKAIYLCDSGTEFEGLNIWGSPWTKTFEAMNPKCKAFTHDTDEELEKKWALIPDDTDIVITHGPIHGILDYVNKKEFVGSPELRNHVLDRIKPSLHVCAHIHEGYGIEQSYNEKYEPTIFVNASIMNERYKPVNKPIRIIL